MMTGARLGRAALLGWAALAIVAPGTGAAEREFATIVALGGTWPVASGEGLATPLVVVDHEGENPLGTGTLNLTLRTSTGEAVVRHPLGSAWEAEGRGRVTVISQGDGSDRYVDGERRDPETFEGEGMAGAVGLRLFPEGEWGAALELEHLQTRFRRVPETDPAFAPPPDFAQDEARLRVQRRRLLGEEEAELVLTGSVARRFGWRSWGLEPNGATRAFQRFMLEWSQPWQWKQNASTKINFKALAGTGLDYLSAYRIGGMGGQYSLPAFYRNEFRAVRAWILAVEQEWAPEEDRRLVVFAGASGLRELDDPVGGGPGPTRRLGSVGLGFRYGIRALKGLPVIVRVAEGLGVPKNAAESHRREFLLVLAAGF